MAAGSIHSLDSEVSFLGGLHNPCSVRNVTFFTRHMISSVCDHLKSKFKNKSVFTFFVNRVPSFYFISCILCFKHRRVVQNRVKSLYVVSNTFQVTLHSLRISLAITV